MLEIAQVESKLSDVRRQHLSMDFPDVGCPTILVLGSKNSLTELSSYIMSHCQRMKKTIVIAVTNQKGGEGKTTTAINLSFALAKRGKRTLLVDMDPQANTTGIFINPDKLNKSLYDVFNSKVPVSEIVVDTNEPNLRLVPSKITLAEVESIGANVDAPYILRDALQAITDLDFIVIDCPPSLSIFTINALVAATHVVIPAQAEKFSIDGMSGLQNTINSIKRRINPDLTVAGALITQLKPKTVLTKTILPVVSQFFTVFDSTISEGVAIGESHLAKKSIFDYAPDSKQAKEYQDFLEELLRELKA